MSDIHALSGAYAIDALSDFERAEIDRHLASCTQCRDEVRGLREAAAHLADSSASTPPAELRARILANARTVRPLPPVPSASTVLSSAARPPRTRRLVGIAAAAALVAGIGAGVTAGVWKPWQPDTVQLSLADRIRQAPDAQVWTQRLPDGGHATLTRSESVGGAVWQSSGLTAAPSGRVYELWLQAPDERLNPAGLMSSGDGEVVLRGDTAHAIGAGLTEEPAGGSPAPTTKPLVFFDLRSKT